MNEVCRQQETECIKEKPQLSTEKLLAKQAKSSCIMEWVRNETRISEVKDQLSWKSFDSKWKINLLFPDKDCRNTEMTFDIAEQKITYAGNTIKLDLPSWANINQISFDDKWINIQWALKTMFWSFTWEWKAPYDWLIKAIDEVISKWSSVIASEGWEIIFTKIV